MKPISEWYPPSKYLFKPIYNFLRRKAGFNQYTSYMLTYDISAGLHATPFLAQERYTEAAIFGGIFVGLGLLGAGAKYLKNRERNGNKQITLDSLIETAPEVIDE